MSSFQQLDARCRVETPEGIEFDSSPVGPIPRVMAYFIDLCWRTLIVSVIGVISLMLGKVGAGFFFITAFLLEWFYPVYFEIFKNGQTPGKKKYGLRVVNDDFTPVSWGNSCIRNLLRSADFLPFLYTFGLISMVVSSKFQRLGDLAAGTLVVYETKNQKQEGLPEGVGAKPSSVRLSAEEQHCFKNFMLRSEIISESRQIELANILRPILKQDGQAGLQELKSIGAWLLGKK
ncbi:MAG: RDD family protein [Porticoccaceae bacterium]|nr:RDD family protein [Pseudomonadales bacterium]